MIDGKYAERQLIKSGAHKYIRYNNPASAFIAICLLGSPDHEYDPGYFDNGVLALRTKIAIAFIAGVDLVAERVFGGDFYVHHVRVFYNGGFDVKPKARNSDLVNSLRNLPRNIVLGSIWPKHFACVSGYNNGLQFAISEKALGSPASYYFTPPVFTVGQWASEIEHLGKFLEVARALQDTGAFLNIWSASFQHRATSMRVSGEKKAIIDVVEQFGAEITDNYEHDSWFNCTVEVKRD